MADLGGELSFFQDIHVRIDIRIDLHLYKNYDHQICKQVHLQDLTQMRLIKQILVKSLHQDHVSN